jgi:hypothetical protein
MKIQLILLGIALSLSSCGSPSESGSGSESALGTDMGGEEDAGLSVAPPTGDSVPTPMAFIKVLNVGAACTTDRDCSGPKSECMERRLTSRYTGGYCTADCSSDADCGSEGACPVGETKRQEPLFPIGATWAHKCFRVCTPGTEGSCRPGYQCQSLARAYGVSVVAPMAPQRSVCIPLPGGSVVIDDRDAAVREPRDAGARDAATPGPVSSDGGASRITDGGP